jgi:hypothetical protein
MSSKLNKQVFQTIKMLYLVKDLQKIKGVYVVVLFFGRVGRVANVLRTGRANVR